MAASGQGRIERRLAGILAAGMRRARVHRATWEHGSSVVARRERSAGGDASDRVRQLGFARRLPATVSFSKGTMIGFLSARESGSWPHLVEAFRQGLDAPPR